MIKNFEHATEVQIRRYKLKKKGIARAIRRWMKQKPIAKTSTYYSKLRSIANFAGCREDPVTKTIVMTTYDLETWKEPNDRLTRMAVDGKWI